jgi:ABC-type transport system involved in Fe-S cluster assembly fused permease/ATPase subunit
MLSVLKYLTCKIEQSQSSIRQKYDSESDTKLVKSLKNIKIVKPFEEKLSQNLQDSKSETENYSKKFTEKNDKNLVLEFY